MEMLGERAKNSFLSTPFSNANHGSFLLLTLFTELVGAILWVRIHFFPMIKTHCLISQTESDQVL